MLWLDGVTTKPTTRIEVSYRRDLQLLVGGAPALTVRIDDDHYGYHWQRAERGVPVLPPLRADEARGRDDEQWLHAIARALRDSPASPLYRGKWALGPLGDLFPDYASLRQSLLEAPLADREDGYTEWDIGDVLPPLLLQIPPRQDDGRVKAFRKLAREGQLPPVLMWWVSGLDRLVVLDGAPRLVASISEGVEPRVLALAAARVATRAWPARTRS